MAELALLIKQEAPLDEIGEFLRRLSHESRVNEMKDVSAALQANIFARAKSGLTLVDLIPSSTPSLTEIIFTGRNSFPCFNNFEKRMCLSSDRKIIWGYNKHAMDWLTGPGYFAITDATDRPDELMIDYTKIPYEKPEAWPPIRSNETGMGRLVNGDLKDFVRQVGPHFFIGEATKKGKIVGYFMLAPRLPE